MKYSFLSSAPEWPPSALMMAVSASGASSEPLASWVRYVPVEGMRDKRARERGRRNEILELSFAHRCSGSVHLPTEDASHCTTTMLDSESLE